MSEAHPWSCDCDRCLELRRGGMGDNVCVSLARRWGKTRLAAIELERRGCAPAGSAQRLADALDGAWPTLKPPPPRAA